MKLVATAAAFAGLAFAAPQGKYCGEKSVLAGAYTAFVQMDASDTGATFRIDGDMHWAHCKMEWEASDDGRLSLSEPQSSCLSRLIALKMDGEQPELSHVTDGDKDEVLVKAHVSLGSVLPGTTIEITLDKETCSKPHGHREL